MNITGHFRNLPCPCGSGRKAKLCCTSGEAHNIHRAKEREARIKANHERKAAPRPMKGSMTTMALLSLMAGIGGVGSTHLWHPTTKPPRTP